MWTPPWKMCDFFHHIRGPRRLSLGGASVARVVVLVILALVSFVHFSSPPRDSIRIGASSTGAAERAHVARTVPPPRRGRPPTRGAARRSKSINFKIKTAWAPTSPWECTDAKDKAKQAVDALKQQRLGFETKRRETASKLDETKEAPRRRRRQLDEFDPAQQGT